MLDTLFLVNSVLTQQCLDLIKDLVQVLNAIINHNSRAT